MNVLDVRVVNSIEEAVGRHMGKHYINTAELSKESLGSGFIFHCLGEVLFCIPSGILQPSGFKVVFESSYPYPPEGCSCVVNYPNSSLPYIPIVKRKRE